MLSRTCAVLALGLATFVPSMFATTYTGSDKSCFGVGACSMVSGTTSYGLFNRDLTFTSSSFTQVGNGDIKLGTFSLGTSPSLFAGAFELDVTFSAPPGVNGSGAFDALLGGVVGFNEQGFAVISFLNPTTESFTYPGGNFSLSLDQTLITLCPGTSMNLTATLNGTDGTLAGTATPEPTSMLLLGGGLGLLGVVRFRRSAKQQVA